MLLHFRPRLRLVHDRPVLDVEHHTWNGQALGAQDDEPRAGAAHREGLRLGASSLIVTLRMPIPGLKTTGWDLPLANCEPGLDGEEEK